MTPYELFERLVGFQDKEKEYWRKMAKLFAAIFSALVGKWIKPSYLLPEVFPAPPIYTKEEKQKILDEIKEEVGLN